MRPVSLAVFASLVLIPLASQAQTLSAVGTYSLSAAPGTDEADLVLSFAATAQTPAATVYVARGENTTHTVEYEYRCGLIQRFAGGDPEGSATQKELLTLTISAVSVLDGRFIMARDLTDDQQYGVSVKSPYGAAASYRLVRGGVEVGSFRVSDGVAPFVITSPFDRDRAAIVDGGRGEVARFTLDRSDGATVRAAFADGRRIDFDALEITIAVDDPAGAHEYGHLFTARHDHLTGLEEGTLRLAD